MKPLISVIIPVYNTEQYVEQCVNSVACQMDDQVECIIVDDGSTDGSVPLCKRIREEHPELSITLIHQENQGLSGARNTGMKAVSGTYLMFLDSDDMLVDGAIECLKGHVQDNPDVELFMYDALVKNETSDPYPDNEYDRSSKVPHKVLSGLEFFSDWYMGKMTVSSCLCLYKTSFLKSNQFEFTLGKLHEDNAFSFKTTLLAREVLYIPQKLYVRRVRDNSITTIKVDHRHYDGICSAYEECMDFIEKNTPGGANSTVKYYNALCRYLSFGIDIIIGKCHQSNGDISFAQKTLNRMMGYMIDSPETITYSGLFTTEKCLKLFKQEGVELSRRNIDNTKMVLGCRDESEFEDRIALEMQRKREDIALQLPLCDANLNIGIYGMGVHTSQLIEECSKHKEIEANIFFVDSNRYSGEVGILDKKIFNVKEIPVDTDYVIISSWVHHNEMLLNLMKYAGEKVKIIDLYENEKAPLYGY
ncbi:glycosyltransferase family 2 protein [Butyrivibrio proteoclasticus]|uniref:glycosyltransferase family 2 protein n=1 Tax=Butyrivibrio proteoclasticus TaxID=43305 RepID=UPI00047EABC8|nr:glycosyltransferase [Butyrivibrio proteoclasticus]